MDEAKVGQSIFPLHRTKTIHLVRHAQGVHNLENLNKTLSWDELFDAQLTPLGWNQVDSVRKHIRACGLSKRIDLVIVSPLLRTMQTAVGVFGCESEEDENVPLMAENVGKSDRPTLTSSNSPPFLAIELCREGLAGQPSEKRRSISEYRHLFPAIDFSLIESDEDNLWKPDFRETESEIAARGQKLLNWLWTRKEKEIAMVSHYVFLLETLKLVATNSHPSISSEICKPFENCEVRSVVITDNKASMGSDFSTTDYIPISK